MAQVWVARQKGKHGFEKLFAFKCIHERFADVPAFRSMFLDEARIAAAIEHPNVAQVFDLGESGTMLYLVIEYVDGESLGALMTAASRRANQSVVVPTGVALRIIADACAGLHAAHSLKDASGNPLNVVHRDVSPQNILVSVKGDVKVIDFGIAHAKDRIGGDTGEGSLKGKVHYMAPEQALHQEISAAHRRVRARRDALPDARRIPPRSTAATTPRRCTSCSARTLRLPCRRTCRRSWARSWSAPSPAIRAIATRPPSACRPRSRTRSSRRASSETSRGGSPRTPPTPRWIDARRSRPAPRTSALLWRSRRSMRSSRRRRIARDRSRRRPTPRGRLRLLPGRPR